WLGKDPLGSNRGQGGATDIAHQGSPAQRTTDVLFRAGPICRQRRRSVAPAL
ncbi:hypothetical protein FOTG_19185, partial [Fusarium oxysporum f. sp. vasinfectum 25433]